jgi:hypothetical protein
LVTVGFLDDDGEDAVAGADVVDLAVLLAFALFCAAAG